MYAWMLGVGRIPVGVPHPALGEASRIVRTEKLFTVYADQNTRSAIYFL
jgi:hypothetical protein